ncbi:MAG: hypothetical protein BM562_01425 [Alphaproteobacteria bacterium MedPE-SWcel]|nr:MAG: hypothetical protein BM562_01425 [Alphaproteobacteria bacterium MedPE-SWcel]
MIFADLTWLAEPEEKMSALSRLNILHTPRALLEHLMVIGTRPNILDHLAKIHNMISDLPGASGKQGQTPGERGPEIPRLEHVALQKMKVGSETSSANRWVFSDADILIGAMVSLESCSARSRNNAEWELSVAASPLAAAATRTAVLELHLIAVAMCRFPARLLARLQMN